MLTAGHRELIKILAAQAVEEFSNETEHKKKAAPLRDRKAATTRKERQCQSYANRKTK